MTTKMMMMTAESYELEQHRAFNSDPHYAFQFHTTAALWAARVTSRQRARKGRMAMGV
jgi:hypothetical protein